MTKQKKRQIANMIIYKKTKGQNTKVTKYNKTEKIWHNTKKQKTNMTKYNTVLLRQIKWQKTKSQNTNVTKCKKIKYKYDKTQKDKLYIWQNSITQNTNTIKHKKTKYKSGNIQKDKMQIWHNTKKTKQAGAELGQAQAQLCLVDQKCWLVKLFEWFELYIFGSLFLKCLK